jgi:hypothetical protein
MFTLNESANKRVRQRTTAAAPTQKFVFPAPSSERKQRRSFFTLTLIIGCFTVALVAVVCVLFFFTSHGFTKTESGALEARIVSSVNQDASIDDQIKAAQAAVYTFLTPDYENPPPPPPPPPPAVPVPLFEDVMVAQAAMPFVEPSKGVLLVTFLDWKPGSVQSQLVANWARRARLIGVKCLIMLCEASPPNAASTGGLETCVMAHAPACADNLRVKRWNYVRSFISAGYDVLHTDPDVALVRNPVPHFARLARAHQAADLFVSSDSNTGVYVYGNKVKSNGGELSANGLYFRSALQAPGERGPLPPTLWEVTFPGAPVNTTFLVRPEHAWRDAFGAVELAHTLREGRIELGLDDPGNCWPHQMNVGNILLRASMRTGALMDRWMARMATGREDQLPFCDVARNGSSQCAFSGKELINTALCGGDEMLNSVAAGTACMGILALAQFSNWFTYGVSREHEQYGVIPFAFHANTNGDKLMELRESGLAVDDSSYYSGRFLAYDPQLAAAALQPTAVRNYTNHFYFVQHQLKQLRAALAIAAALNRTLVLPRVAFACESFFYAVGPDCVIEGHRLRLPYIAPTDHWLRPGRLRFPVREPGFLDHPLFPEASLAATATLSACNDTVACEAHAGGASVPPRSSDGLLRDQMQSFKDKAVVWVVLPEEVWGGFESETDQQSFDKALESVLGVWCCAQNDDKKLWPDAAALQVQYAWDGEPVLHPVNDPSAVKMGEA